MISLKKTIEAFDYRAMWEAAFESYRSAIQSLEKNAINLEREGLHEYRLRLQSLKTRLETTEIRPEDLRSHALELGDELGRYRSELESLLKDTGNDLKELVAVLAEATESLSQRGSLHGGQLSRISGSLEAIAQIEDPTQMRTTLNRQVFELRTCITQMSKANESALVSLQQEMAGFQKRLEKVQIEASR